MSKVNTLIEIVRDSAQKDIELTITVRSGGVRWAIDKLPARKDGHRKQLIPYRTTGRNEGNMPYEELDAVAQEFIEQLAINALEAGALLPEREW